MNELGLPKSDSKSLINMALNEITHTLSRLCAALLLCAAMTGIG